ncbi:MAG TPA: lactate racemase domain-containing protein [Candidatus Acidoferrales bacterium]|nr:lactate racemase domain-containing protein [Candidatus Acidoferrales bacterium]
MPHRSPDSEGRLSDPPVVASVAPATTRPAFPEFERGTLPPWALVRQRLDATEIGDVREAVRAALEPVVGVVRPGERVCIAVGSRGIDRLDSVVRATVERLQEAGASVFIVPAMGSHGGATAEGQREVLAGYGITADSMGCEIRSSMETVDLGEVRPGVPVFVDRHAFEGADLIIPVNRVKVHTDFTGPVESGLMKMIAIGLGKQKGADTFHRQGFAVFHELIPAAAAHTLARAPIPFGLALVENGYARLRHVEAVPADLIATREPELLAMATDAMARLPLDSIDVLILDAIGKDVSGLGMDSKVVGRYYAGPTGTSPAIQRIVVRDLTDQTDGNGVGIGMADVALRRAVEKIDYRKTYMNSITAKTPEGVRVALTVDSDREALAIALACCLKVAPETSRIVRARDTKHLDLLYVSAPALADVLATGRCEVVEPLRPIAFDGAGMLADRFA